MNTQDRWFDAIQAFHSNINAIVICPLCDEGILVPIDIPSTKENRGERILKCTSCNGEQIIFYKTPPPNFSR